MPVDPDQLVERIRAIPKTPGGGRRLAAMLRRDQAPFRGLSTADAEWVRGHVLAGFEHRPAPHEAIVAIREELRTSADPVVLAGAARAVRGLVDGPADWRPLLEAASQRLGSGDRFVGFDADGPARTAAEEIALTLAARAPAHCCAAEGLRSAGDTTLSLCPGALRPAVVEDQDGGTSPLTDLLRARRSLVAFFYTRCMNPAKCSLTVTRLAAIARAAGGEANVLGISYDADFDTPDRLLRYGRDRSFPFGETSRLLRCASGWAAVRAQFRLDVGYGETTVNSHAREAFVVEPDLTVRGLDPERLADPAVWSA